MVSCYVHLSMYTLSHTNQPSNQLRLTVAGWLAWGGGGGGGAKTPTCIHLSSFVTFHLSLQGIGDFVVRMCFSGCFCK